MTKQKTKRFYEKFKSFDEKEQWLMDQAQNGWRLVSYASEEFDDCIYKFVQDDAAKEYRYKIDFREFSSKTDFEYKGLFYGTLMCLGATGMYTINAMKSKKIINKAGMGES